MAAVRNHQFHVRRFACRDHGLGIRDGSAHRLFTHHMFACLGRANRILRVHRIRQRHINRIDVRIVRNLVEVIVAVNRAGRHAVLRRNLVRFIAMAAHQGGHAGVRRVLDSRHKVVRNPSDSNDRVAGLARRVLRVERRRKAGRQAQCAKPCEIPAGQLHGFGFLCGGSSRVNRVRQTECLQSTLLPERPGSIDFSRRLQILT